LFALLLLLLQTNNTLLIPVGKLHYVNGASMILTSVISFLSLCIISYIWHSDSERRAINHVSIGYPAQ